MDPPKKRGRGRPRKTAAMPPLSEESSIASSIGITEPQEIHELPEPPMMRMEQEEEESYALPGLPKAQAHEVIEEEVPEIQAVTYSMPEPQYSRPAPIPEEKPKKETKRSDLLMKIKKYKNNFKMLERFEINENGSIEYLNTTLEEMRMAVSTKNTHAVVKAAYLVSVKGVEVIGGKVGGKLYGLSDMLAKSADIDDVLKEIECEMTFTSISPMKRLAFITLSSALAVDSLNRRSELLNTFGKEKVNPDLKTKYEGI